MNLLEEEKTFVYSEDQYIRYLIVTYYMRAIERMGEFERHIFMRKINVGAKAEWRENLLKIFALTENKIRMKDRKLYDYLI